MQHAPAQEPPPSIEMSLREQLLAAQHSSPYPPPPPTVAQGREHPYQPSDSASPHEHIDPAVAHQQQHAPYAQMSGDSAGDDSMSPQTGKGKRELSTSKRAAQNRAAQRAFRQRKEGYIKKLEEQVKEFQAMEQAYRGLQTENYQLREYILNLQTRLLETNAEIPPAPPHINLSSTGAGSSGVMSDRPHGAQDAISQLQAAAAHAEAASRPLHESPYGLGGAGGNSNKRARPEEHDNAGGDMKAGS
ncbi:hypothetical protein M433DRAFT_145643 [Acidomyces richmondensis BFW]|nr:MAG: hypothetical protein FE78DRAFT_82347 [Acidomyces sp. 'richmondensis']KYG43647.1 hypothetical protein M433DRAFT_145643 [Acidomyces richmondensis BFW]